MECAVFQVFPQGRALISHNFANHRHLQTAHLSYAQQVPEIIVKPFLKVHDPDFQSFAVRVPAGDIHFRRREVSG
jgi:hypothetical protein